MGPVIDPLTLSPVTCELTFATSLWWNFVCHWDGWPWFFWIHCGVPVTTITYKCQTTNNNNNVILLRLICLHFRSLISWQRTYIIHKDYRRFITHLVHFGGSTPRMWWKQLVEDETFKSNSKPTWAQVCLHKSSSRWIKVSPWSNIRQLCTLQVQRLGALRHPQVLFITTHTASYVVIITTIYDTTGSSVQISGGYRQTSYRYVLSTSVLSYGRPAG